MCVLLNMIYECQMMIAFVYLSSDALNFAVIIKRSDFEAVNLAKCGLHRVDPQIAQLSHPHSYPAAPIMLF